MQYAFMACKCYTIKTEFCILKLPQTMIGDVDIRNQVGKDQPISLWSEIAASGTIFCFVLGSGCL